MLSRPHENVRSEWELSEEAGKILKKHQRVFVLCSSTNIDRIHTFCRANPDRRPIVCDRYQKNVLDTAVNNAPGWLNGYDFRQVIPDSPRNQKLHEWMD